MAAFARAPAPQPSVLHSLEREFRLIEEMDPSLADGFRIAYDREVPFELRPCTTGAAGEAVPEPQAGALEGVKVKIVTQGEENAITAMRVELSSDADLFFHYCCIINHVGFHQLRENQKLMCDFKEFTVTLMKMFNQCIRDPQQFLAVLLFQENGSATLQLIQNLEYKFVELLQLPFHESADATIRQHVTYRYNAMRSRLSIMTAKLQDVSALVKVRNPAVMDQLAAGAAADVDVSRGGDRSYHSRLL